MTDLFDFQVRDLQNNQLHTSLCYNLLLCDENGQLLSPLFAQNKVKEDENKPIYGKLVDVMFTNSDSKLIKNNWNLLSTTSENNLDIYCTSYNAENKEDKHCYQHVYYKLQETFMYDCTQLPTECSQLVLEYVGNFSEEKTLLLVEFISYTFNNQVLFTPKFYWENYQMNINTHIRQLLIQEFKHYVTVTKMNVKTGQPEPLEIDQVFYTLDQTPIVLEYTPFQKPTKWAATILGFSIKDYYFDCLLIRGYIRKQLPLINDLPKEALCTVSKKLLGEVKQENYISLENKNIWKQTHSSIFHEQTGFIFKRNDNITYNAYFFNKEKMNYLIPESDNTESFTTSKQNLGIYLGLFLNSNNIPKFNIKGFDEC